MNADVKPIVEIKEIDFVLIYIDNLESGLSFYTKYFGFNTEFTMDNETSHYGKMGGIYAWIGSGYKVASQRKDDTRTTFMLSIDSVGTLLEELKKDGLEVLQESPKEMQPNVYWLQFKDPAGNILEVLGGK